MARFKKLLVRVNHFSLDSLLLALLTLEDDGVLSVLLHHTTGNHLVDNAGSLFAFLRARLKLSDFISKPGNLDNSVLILHLLRDFLLLVLLDLLLAPSSLTLRLHHVGRCTFGLCEINRSHVQSKKEVIDAKDGPY